MGVDAVLCDWPRSISWYTGGAGRQPAEAGDRSSLVPLRLSIYREIHRNWPLSATNCGTNLGKGVGTGSVPCAAIDQIQRLSGN